MSDYDYDGFEDEPPTTEGTGLTLPGGISVQAAAALLLVAVLIATLYLFFGPNPDSPADAPDGAVAGATATVMTSATRASAPTVRSGTAAAGGPTAAATAVVAASAGASPAAGTATTAASMSPTVQATRPPSPIDGGFVEVVGTDGFGMRYRFGPGLDTLTIRIVEEGEVLKVSGQPDDVRGTTWWRLQDRLGNVGWAVEDYLSPAAPPTSWNPPIASPTFDATAP